MSEQIDWSKAPEGATHYFPSTEVWYMAGNGCAPLVWTGMWRKAFQFSQREHKCVQRPTTPSWSGEGMPPVGVVCEVKLQEEWSLCEIIAHFQQPQAMVAAFTVAQFHGGKKLDSKIAECFRPIRTPEQIAADEREVAIAEMKRVFDSVSDNLIPTSNSYLETIFGALHDKGYRKP